MCVMPVGSFGFNAMQVRKRILAAAAAALGWNEDEFLPVAELRAQVEIITIFYALKVLKMIHGANLAGK